MGLARLGRSVSEAELRRAERGLVSASGTAASGGGSGSRSISTVMLPAAISRSATTVGLSFSSATVGSAPLARRRARCAASSTSWNRLSTLCRQSSTVTRAMGSLQVNRSRAACAGSITISETGARRPALRARRRFAAQAGVSSSCSSGPSCGRLPLRSSLVPVDDAHEVRDRLLEVVVDDHVVEFVVVGHVAGRVPQPARDHLGRVGRAPCEPLLERCRDGGRMKMVTQSGIAWRTCRAPCQSISSSTSWPAASCDSTKRAPGAVVVVEHPGVLEKLAARHQILELTLARRSGTRAPRARWDGARAWCARPKGAGAARSRAGPSRGRSCRRPRVPR